MGIVNDIIDEVYLINLDRRTDMLAHATFQCDSMGIKFTRISAIDGKKEIDPSEVKTYPGMDPKYWNVGALALLRTTRRIIENAIEKGHKRIMILEDDVIFSEDFNDKISLIEKAAPYDWQLINCGIHNVIAPERVSKHFVRTKVGFCLQCYIINSSLFEFYLNYLNQELKQIDMITAEDLTIIGTSYAFTKNITFQKEKFSDINNEIASRSFLLDSKPIIDFNI